MGGQPDHLTRPTNLDLLLMFPRIMIGLKGRLRNGSAIFEPRALILCMRTPYPLVVLGKLSNQAYGEVDF